MAIEVKRKLMPADIERMITCGQLTEHDTFELINGEIVWLAPAYDPQSGTCSLITVELGAFAKRIGARLFDSNGGFMVGDQLQQLSCPDVSLVSKERLHILRATGFAAGAPDLAVEVLAASQYGEAYAISKMGEYFGAGCKVIWFVDFRSRTVRAYESGKSEYLVYSAEAEITLDAIAPGFRCRVSSFFYD